MNDIVEGRRKMSANLRHDNADGFDAVLRPDPRKGRPTVPDGHDARKVHVGDHFNPEVARQLKMPGAEAGTTMRMLMAEAPDLLFASRGKSTIARES